MIVKADEGRLVAAGAVASMKSEIMADAELWGRLATSDEAAMTSILEARFSDRFDDAREAATAVAREIVELRKEPGQYLVDRSGKTLFRLTDDMVHVPQEARREDGAIVAGVPALHPKIASTLTVLAHERARLREAEEAGGRAALAHVRDPWKIVESAALEAERGGPEMVTAADPRLNTKLTVNIGHETPDILQAPNNMFHRSTAFGAALVARMRAAGAVAFHVASVERRTKAKSTWFEVKVEAALPQPV